MFRKSGQKSLASLLARRSAIVLIAAFMPLGIHLTVDGVTIGAPAAHAQGKSGEAHGGGPGEDNDNNDHGEMSSALGALNAAHASPTARAHAAPNSRVGRIAATVGPLSDWRAAQEVVDALQAIIDDLESTPAEILAAEADPLTALDDLAAKQGLAQTSVEAAANKPVDQSILAALAELLGL